MTETVYLGLGSNVGDREGFIHQAVRSLGDKAGRLETASLYETYPQDYENQPYFCNTAVRGSFEGDPQTLLKYLHSLEQSLGRNRERETLRGARTIDIDILLFGERIIDEEGLQVPHPRMKQRKFVLLPLLELNPFLTEPETSVPYITYFNRIQDQGIYYFNLKRYNALHR